MQSEVEQLYAKVRDQQGGDYPWEMLPVHVQIAFTQAVNTILQVANARVSPTANN